MAQVASEGSAHSAQRVRMVQASTQEIVETTAIQVTITVYQQSGKHYASRTFSGNIPNFSPPGVVFSITEDIGMDNVEKLETKAREEARRRGIPHVINLD